MKNHLKLVTGFPDWDAVDMFAGGGGSTTGAELAGLIVKVAANHWDPALATHKANHPLVEHLKEDISVMDPHKVAKFVGLPRERKRRLLGMGSPSCTGHSGARGEDRPEHDRARMTANGLLHVWELLLPDVTFTENVEEFLDWSSQTVMDQPGWRQRLTDRIIVYKGDTTPHERRAGKLFMAWKAFMEGLGYKLTVNILNAMHFDVPQDRERVVIIGSLHEQPKPVVYPKNARIITAAEVLDFEDDNAEWRPFSKIRSEATRASIMRGIRDGCGDRFIKLYYSNGSGLTGRRLDRPLPTIPAADVVALVDCKRGKEPHLRIATMKELLRGMSFADNYTVMGSKKDKKTGRVSYVPYDEGGARADCTAQIGNAVPPRMAKGIIEQTLKAAA